ncbi:MAG TPA: DNA starvation/stationary phase protection protein [Actinophytocola sp.]|uniref:Dps family protein n=1 Tax=Actinophytocola sp. TaxID=1872138 RepID=UPI002DBAB328|nr:DNA starvation/stationary phase protection protein [Actinophytocola sp.]HEU5474017.1 DNA starvation/stationary phase protection protein [Actinophytocola sp.]
MTKSPITSPLGDAERQTTGGILQSTLVDLLDLSLIGKQAHWNVVGPHFRSVHLHLDELVGIARQYVDEVAERANAIGVSPNGMAHTVVETSGLPDFPANWVSDGETIEKIVNTLGALAARLRGRIDEADKSDLVTQDLLIEIAREVEKQHWMWQAQLGRVL